MRHGSMHIGVFFKNTGHHLASWRDQGAQPDAGINIAHYMDCAKVSEAAGFDFIFFADSVAVRPGAAEALARSAQYIAYFEPTTLLSALSAVTQKIGLVTTANTTYNAPYHVARKFASLDHLSHGRAGWNIVTSGSKEQAANFGLRWPFDHDELYRQASEFVAVVKGLWDSWEDDAFIYDRVSGLFLDPAKMHRLDHAGEFYQVAGPLNIARPPQGYPVLFQAGGSAAGQAFCSAIAEGVFTGFHTIASAQQHYTAVKTGMDRFGRNQSEMKILAGCSIFVGRTEAEAMEREEALAELIDPIVGREYITMLSGIDLSDIGPDDKIPWERASTIVSRSSFEQLKNFALDNDLSLRQLYRRLAASFNKLTLSGTPSGIADQMQAWYDAHACDGFILQPSVMPADLTDIANLLVPELKHRGLMRADYEGATLRDHLGLTRPANPYAAKHHGAA